MINRFSWYEGVYEIEKFHDDKLVIDFKNETIFNKYKTLFNLYCKTIEWRVKDGYIDQILEDFNSCMIHGDSEVYIRMKVEENKIILMLDSEIELIEFKSSLLNFFKGDDCVFIYPLQILLEIILIKLRQVS